jgi:hypothetical protein
MLKFLLIFCFICVVSYLIFVFLLPCISLFKDGEESELYKKVSDEIVDYCKEKDIDMNTDDDFLYQQIYIVAKAIVSIIIVIIIIMFALLCLVI